MGPADPPQTLLYCALPREITGHQLESSSNVLKIFCDQHSHGFPSLFISTGKGWRRVCVCQGQGKPEERANTDYPREV